MHDQASCRANDRIRGAEEEEVRKGWRKAGQRQRAPDEGRGALMRPSGGQRSRA